MTLTHWHGSINDLGPLFRQMGVTLIDDRICHQVRRFVRHWTRKRRRSRYAERVVVSLLWSPTRGVDAGASRVNYI